MTAPNDKIFLHGLKVKCLIGILRWERKTLQKVIVDLEFPADVRKAARSDRIEDTLDYQKIAGQTVSFVAHSRFYLVETLAEKLAGMLLAKFPLRAVTVRISKPGAIRAAKNAGVEITRRKK